MAEVAGAGEGHGHVPFVGGRDDFGVADGAAGLNSGGGSRGGGGDEAVWKREEGITADYAGFQGEICFAGFPHSDAAGIDTAHLAGADAEGPVGTDVDDRV